MNGPREAGPVDAELLGRLLDEHGPALALFAAQWTDAADDCVQEAFVELAAQRRIPENPRAWLYRVAKHRALNAARGSRRRRERETRVARERLVVKGRWSDDRLGALAVSEAIERLDPEERELVVMRIWGGLTFEEIAGLLSVSIATAHRKYQGALERLRRHLESPCTTNDDTTKSHFPPS